MPTGVSATSAIGSETIIAKAVVAVSGVTASVSIGNIRIWSEVDEDQSSNFVPVNESQTPNWNTVNDTQNPDWSLHKIRRTDVIGCPNTPSPCQ